jgi:hypothetical protein
VVLNAIFDHLRFIEFESELWSAPAIMREVNSQMVMLDGLAESEPSPRLLTRGREDDLFSVEY